MTAPAELLDEVAAEGVNVDLKPDGKLFVTPKDRVTPEIIARLKAAKPALVELLRQRGELCQRAVAGLTDTRHRAAVLERAGDGTYVAAVAVRMTSGNVAVAVLTRIQGDWDQLLLAFQRSCEAPVQ